MESIFLDFQTILDKNPIQIENKYLDRIFKKFSFYLFTKNKNIFDDITKIQTKRDHQIVFISEYLDNTNKFCFSSDFFIICFEYTIIFIEQTEINQLYTFFTQNKEFPIYVFSEDIKRIKILIEENMNLHLKIENSKENRYFSKEIRSFSQNFHLAKNKKTMNLFKPFNNLIKRITETISGYFIQKSYFKSKQYDRVINYNDYTEKRKEIEFKEDEFIVLRSLSKEGVNDISLIYHIELEELFVLKIFLDEKGQTLFERENENYKQINFPLFPKYFGTAHYFTYKCIVIEYIQGKLLKDIHEMNFNYNLKIKIIFQIIIALQYLHYHGYIYRDLKPNNIFINERGSIIMIDFDRMISDSQNYQFTIDFQHDFIAPEVVSGSSFSNKSDIYSLGKIIEFIFSNSFTEKNAELKDLCEKCTIFNATKRPDISQLIDTFYDNFFSKIRLIDENDTIKNDYDIQYPQFFYFNFFLSEYNHDKSHYYLEQFHTDISKSNDSQEIIQNLISSANQNDSNSQFTLGYLYEKGQYVYKDINKSIYYYSLAADKNNSDAQLRLGTIYYNGEFVSRDINKAIHYFSLAADQNNSDAQLRLGTIYYNGEFVPRDINKAIHYFTLASNLNNSSANYELGTIYLSGEFIPRNIDKSIHFLTLSSNQNNSEAQLLLGKLFINGKFIPVDITKSIYYFKLSSNQNNANAQYILGYFYYKGKYIKQDIKQAIYYFTLAANQNHPIAQYSLGLIYYRRDKISCDINKSIHYFELSANQNYSYAQYNLGVIYEFGELIPRDIDKSIHYYTLSANQNNVKSQFKLGLIFYEGKYIERDINKSIYYFTFAANQNDINAQYKLGIIYYDGHYIQRDIEKSIHYFELSSKQNHPDALHNLGAIYYEGKYIKRDINKSIYYFTLASNKNVQYAQYNLGLIYKNGDHVPKDIDKAVYYFTLAANQNDMNAQYELGLIYKDYYGDIEKAIHYLTLSSDNNNSNAQCALGSIYFNDKIISPDYIKSIHYYSLSAANNNSKAQFILGYLYFIGFFGPRDINKSLQYLSLSVKQYNSQASFMLGVLFLMGIDVPQNIIKSIKYLSFAAEEINVANFYLGCIYCQGIGIDQDLDKAIKYYKECSSFNHQYSKNNLGVLYKNYKRNEIAIEYFEEAIKQKSDLLSMYNLAHIYFYGDFIKENIDKSIELLIKSANNNFYPSKILLSLALVKKIPQINVQSISNETRKYGNIKELDQEILMIIISNKIEYEGIYKKQYSYYENIEFMYDINGNEVEFSSFINTNYENRIPDLNSKYINASFYEGFG